MSIKKEEEHPPQQNTELIKLLMFSSCMWMSTQGIDFSLPDHFQANIFSVGIITENESD